MTIQRIAVLGGGAWGTALALTCARAGRQVTLWEHEPANADNLEQKREKRLGFPNEIGAALAFQL